MAEKGLDMTDVRSTAEQVRGHTVAKAVACSSFFDIGLLGPFLNDAVESRPMKTPSAAPKEKTRSFLRTEEFRASPHEIGLDR